MLQVLKRRLFLGRLANVRLMRMSDGHLALVRELGLVKGGRGLRIHEKIMSFSARAAAHRAMSLISKQRQSIVDGVGEPARDVQI